MRLPAAAILFTLTPSLLHAQATAATPVPAFTDPARRAKLATAFDAIRASMPDQARQIGAPGLAWGVIIDGELAASGAVGVRDLDTKQDATPQSVFRIASMSKSFTALAILKLRDEGRLSLDDAVSKHVPEFAGVRLPTTDAPAITIRHLLTHSEGFPEDNPWGDRQLGISEQTMSDWLKRGLPFSTSPGTAFEYSNYGFALLGRIVGNVAGTPYGDYIRSQILSPLGMKATYWDTGEVPAGRLAHGYRKTGDAWVKEAPLPHGAFGAMGGLYTSTDDLARYVAFMMSAWPPRDDADTGPVRRSSVREMQQGQRPSGLAVFRAAPDSPLTVRASAYAYGLGSTQDCKFRFHVAHGGGLPGFGSSMMWLPEHGVGVIVLANVTYAGAGGVARSVLDRLAATGGLQSRRWPASAPLTSVRATVTSLVNAWNDATFEAAAADNLLLDKPLDERRSEVQALHASLGACAPDGDIDSENWLRGSFRSKCERGWLTTTVTLAPTMPPRIQYLSFAEGRPMTAGLAASVAKVVDGIRGGSVEGLPLSAKADRAVIAQQTRAFSADYGACTLGETLSGNGDTRARVRLSCDRGLADLSVAADGSAALESVALRGAGPCVP